MKYLYSIEKENSYVSYDDEKVMIEAVKYEITNKNDFAVYIEERPKDEKEMCK